LAATSYVANNLGRKFIENTNADLAEILEETTATTPILLILSPGVDPAAKLASLAESKGYASKLQSIALGQGQVRKRG
jgi:dynein heavy chain